MLVVTNFFTHNIKFSFSIFLGLILTSCARYQPDYEINGLRVSAKQINVGTELKPNYKIAWNVETLIFNRGKTVEVNELEDENGIPISHIPIMFTAYVNNQNLHGCPTESSENTRIYRKPGGLMMKAWRYVPISKEGPITSFSNIFTTNASCVPDKIVVDYDSRRSVVFTPSTIDEVDESNNSLNVSILDFPTKTTWTVQKKEE